MSLSSGTPAFRPRSLDRAAWAALAGGAGLAAVAFAVPWARFALSYLATLVHELGHALVGWVFGYPSVPRFDFTYGGGLTTTQHRSALVLGAVYVALAGLVIAYRRNGATRLVLAAGAGLFVLCAHTRVHEVIILFMGHGMELAIVGVFLYRALSGSAVVHAAERPLYAACGLFLLGSDVSFGWRLMTSPAARAAYGAAKGGGHWMDFDRIAREYLHVGLPAVAVGFLVCCVATVVATFLVFRYQERLFDGLARLVDKRPD